MMKVKANKKIISGFRILEKPTPKDAIYIKSQGKWVMICPLFSAFIRGLMNLPREFWVVELVVPIVAEEVEIESTISVEPLAPEELVEIKKKLNNLSLAF